MSSPIPPEERLSAEFDAGLISDEVVAEVGPARSDILTQSWQVLGDAVRQIPVDSAEDLSLRVLADIQRDVSAPRVAPLVYPDSRRQTAVAQWVAVLASAAAVVLVTLSLMSGLDVSDQPTRATSVVDGTEDVSRNPDDWEVVVVTLPDDGSHGVSDLVRETVTGGGMQLHALAGHAVQEDGHPDLLMASAGLSEKLHRIFQSDIGHLDAQFNPDQIGDLGRAELLQKVAESMQTPTQSDLYFGEMFVVLPDDNSIVVRAIPPGTPLDKIMVADANAEDGTAGSSGLPKSTGRELRSRVGEATISEYLKQGSGKPVLVVLLRKKEVPEDIQGSLDHCLWSSSRT